MLNVLDHLHDALVRQALIDPLTGAYNRRQFQKRLSAATSRAGDQTAALLVFDIDHFKRVNDAFGHDMGDEVLKAVVKLTQAMTRRGDELFRLGGEEFAVLMPDAPPDVAHQFAETLRRQVEATSFFLGQQNSVTISIGISTGTANEHADRLYRQADQALYAAKRQGRNRVVNFVPVEEHDCSTSTSPALDAFDRIRVA